MPLIYTYLYRHKLVTSEAVIGGICVIALKFISDLSVLRYVIHLVLIQFNRRRQESDAKVCPTEKKSIYT